MAKIGDLTLGEQAAIVEEVAREMCRAAGLDPDQFVQNDNGGGSMRWKGYIIPAKQFIAGWRVMVRHTIR